MSGRHWRRGRVEKPDLVVARHVNHKIGSKLRGLAFAACGDRGVSAGTKSAVRKPPYDADPRTGARIEVFYVTAGSKRLAGAELVGSDRIASAALQLPYPPVSNELLRISRRDNQAGPFRLSAWRREPKSEPRLKILVLSASILLPRTRQLEARDVKGEDNAIISDRYWRARRDSNS